jgi:hypothetical protein
MHTWIAFFVLDRSRARLMPASCLDTPLSEGRSGPPERDEWNILLAVRLLALAAQLARLEFDRMAAELVA